MELKRTGELWPDGGLTCQSPPALTHLASEQLTMGRFVGSGQGISSNLKGPSYSLYSLPKHLLPLPSPSQSTSEEVSPSG